MSIDRRKFIQRMGMAASVAAVSPLVDGAARGAVKETINGNNLKDGSLDSDVSGVTGPNGDILSNGFLNPPKSAAPWVYWMWVEVDTTPAAMTRDLEQMKAKGIPGFILYNTPSGSLPHEMPRMVLVEKDGRFEYQFVSEGQYTDCYTTPIPFPPLRAWTKPWRDRIRYVARESLRLGLKFCLAVGLAGTSGQIAEEYGNHKLVWSETLVNGTELFNEVLALPVAAMEGSNGVVGPYFRDVAVMAFPDTAGFPVGQVIDLTSKLDALGRLTWHPPAGSWKILRFLQIATRSHNNWGYFTDAMSAEALDQTWAVTMAPLLKEMSPEERQGIIGVEDDSWEGGVFTWTKKFPEEFKRRRGYDLIPYLPVLAGANLADPAIRQQIQRDYKLTISDLMADYHYGRLDTLCKENGLISYSEAAGPNLHNADLIQNTSHVDVPMAEFWMPSYHRPTPEKRFFVRDAACASHTYGMPVNMDEAFTSMGPEWQEGPFNMKPVSDRAFCDGTNQVCIHNFSHSPSLTAKPGYVYMPGTHYDPGITWWEQTPAFNTYLARCSYLLQQGKFVADAIFYKGDNIGDGDPRKIIYPTLGEGYDYDCSNTDVLLNRMSVKDQRIVLPDGMSYRVLILPDDQPMTLDALQKISDLIHAGATVIGLPPAGLAGMPLVPSDEENFEGLIAHLWGTDRDSSPILKRKLGTGYLVSQQTAHQTLLDAGVPSDFEVSGLTQGGQVYWIHRKMDDADLYFVTSHWPPEEELECTFRISGKQPELWDPATGTMRDAVAFRQEGGRTVIPLKFGPCGSTFVVFRKPVGANIRGRAKTNHPTADTQLTLSGSWDVSFDPKWGGPKQVVFDGLVDWTTRQESGIKFYSGTAIYRKTFDFTKHRAEGTRLFLDMGELHELGSVILNGHDLGVVWIKPARVDVTNLLKSTGNELEITVVNLWPNRLIGDESLPIESRLTATNIHKFNPHTPLLPSGLVGPVKIVSVEWPDKA
jgi:hypothetical protein